MTTSTTAAAKIRTLIGHEASSSDSAARYRKLADAAAELGLEYEAERISAEAEDFESDAEALREQLLALGYTPEEG